LYPQVKPVEIDKSLLYCAIRMEFQLPPALAGGFMRGNRSGALAQINL